MSHVSVAKQGVNGAIFGAKKIITWTVTLAQGGGKAHRVASKPLINIEFHWSERSPTLSFRGQNSISFGTLMEKGIKSRLSVFVSLEKERRKL